MLSISGIVACVITPSWQSGIASRVVKSCLQPVSISQERMSDLGNSSVSSDAGKASPAVSCLRKWKQLLMLCPPPFPFAFPFFLFSPFPGLACKSLRYFPNLQFPCRKNLHGVFGVAPFHGGSGAPISFTCAYPHSLPRAQVPVW